MKIQDYELLVELKKVGTIRGAAEQLLISQPAISQRLKLIEEYWAVQLFIRTPKRLVVTPAGEKVVLHAQEIVNNEQVLRNEIVSSNDEVGGTLSLGVSSVVGQYYLPKILGEFIEKYPKVKLQLKTGLSQVIQKNMHDYHIAIFRGEQVHTQMCEHLFSDDLYLLRRKTKKVIFQPIPLVTFHGDAILQTMIHKWFLEHQKISFSQIIEVDQIETCKQLMKRGVGMAVLPQSTISDLDEKYEATPLIHQGKALTRETWITYSKSAFQLPQVKKFVDMVRYK